MALRPIGARAWGSPGYAADRTHAMPARLGAPVWFNGWGRVHDRRGRKTVRPGRSRSGRRFSAPLASGESALGGVGEEQNECKDHAGDEQEHDPNRQRDDSLCSMEAVVERILPVDGLVDPPVVSRLLGHRRRSTALRVLNISAPQGLMASVTRAGVHGVPLDSGDRAPVANQLACEHRAHVRRQELSRLDLLRNDGRLGLGSRAGLIVGRESEKDRKTQNKRETRSQDTETPDARSPSLD